MEEIGSFRNHRIRYFDDFLEVVFDALVVISKAALNRSKNLSQTLVEFIDHALVAVESAAILGEEFLVLFRRCAQGCPTRPGAVP